MRSTNKNLGILNFEGFVDQLMVNREQTFKYKQSPVQIYPLNVAFKFIKAPTPLFRTDRNFLLLFKDGGGEQQVDNELIKLEANDALFIREGHLNAIKSIHPSSDGYYIYIDNLLISQIFPDKALLNRFTFNPKHSVLKSDMEWLCQCCALLIEYKRNFAAVDDIEASLLKAIVLKLAQNWPTTASQSNRQLEITMRF